MTPHPQPREFFLWQGHELKAPPEPSLEGSTCQESLVSKLGPDPFLSLTSLVLPMFPLVVPFVDESKVGCMVLCYQQLEILAEVISILIPVLGPLTYIL